MIRQMKFLGGLLLAAGLAACGGGGGSSGTTTGSTGGSSVTAPAPAAVEVFTSAPELTSAVNSSITFTVVVKDANNVALPGRTVTFTASSGNLVGAQPIPSTGAAGEAITSVSLAPGADRSNRTITVTVRSGGASKEITIPVTGTKLSLSGDSSMLVGGSSKYTVKATDSAGQPIQNATVTVTSSLGNSLTPSSLVTDIQGAATFNYTGAVSGRDTITASGLGGSSTTSVSISADDLRFESPAVSTTIGVGATQSVVIRYLRNTVPVAGQTVTFSTTRGSVTPMSVATDANGRASAVISSASSGPANVVAQAPSAQVTLPVTFVATQASTLVLQANPGAVPPNAGTSTTNQVTLVATVRDLAGNPVAGRTVNFTAVTDGSNGVLSPGSAVTDSGGAASVQFIPGPLSTANNGVVVQGAVQGSSVTGTASLTVNAQALFIAIATGNVVGSLDSTTYEKEFAVYVTDANGAPAANRVVNLSYYPDRYGKGRLAWNGKVWAYDSSSPTICANEDADRNGILNVGEDFNVDGKLYPGIPVVVSPASVTTASNGFATFKLRYGENQVPWIFGTITARAAVGGTESVKAQVYDIEGQSTDFSNEQVAPAGVTSPYGVATDCANPN